MKHLSKFLTIGVLFAAANMAVAEQKKASNLIASWAKLYSETVVVDITQDLLLTIQKQNGRW